GGFAFQTALAEGFQGAERITPTALQADLRIESFGADLRGQERQVGAEGRRFARLIDEEGIQSSVWRGHDAAEGDLAFLAGGVAKHHDDAVAADQPQRRRQRLAADRLQDQVEPFLECARVILDAYFASLEQRRATLRIARDADYSRARPRGDPDRQMADATRG